MSTLIAGYWLPSQRADPRALALYQRHYSAGKNAPYRGGRSTNFVGPGEPMVLLTERCDALFVWLKNRTARYDGQTGICCVVFRNEGPTLSSALIAEADALAWNRWPGERHFTYVEDGKIASVNPGYCFKRAGWRTCGRNKDGRLTLLERLP
jgi:hypothetical protein